MHRGHVHKRGGHADRAIIHVLEPRRVRLEGRVWDVERAVHQPVLLRRIVTVEPIDAVVDHRPVFRVDVVHIRVRDRHRVLFGGAADVGGARLHGHGRSTVKAILRCVLEVLQDAKADVDFSKDVDVDARIAQTAQDVRSRRGHIRLPGFDLPTDRLIPCGLATLVHVLLCTFGAIEAVCEAHAVAPCPDLVRVPSCHHRRARWHTLGTVGIRSDEIRAAVRERPQVWQRDLRPLRSAWIEQAAIE